MDLNKVLPSFETVYTLDALKGWSHSGTSLAVLGHPVAHSISPQMHNAALKAMAESNAEFRRWGYFKFDIPPENLSEALSLFQRKGFLGLNLTIPHKVIAVALAKTVNRSAQRMGAVNTLLRRSEGYAGYNSDGDGLERALKEELNVELHGASVILLGAGGASRAAAVQCLEKGCKELWIGNRSQSRLNALLNTLKGIEGFERIHPFKLGAKVEGIPRTGVLINATSLGLNLNDPAPLNLDDFDTSLKVYDMIYNPSETPLLQAAIDRGMKAANGLSMLVYQGACSLKIWSGTEVPTKVMMEAARRAMM